MPGGIIEQANGRSDSRISNNVLDNNDDGIVFAVKLSLGRPPIDRLWRRS
jgi:hypothetical protein